MTPLTACKLTSHLTCHRFAVLGGDTRMRYVAERLSEAGCPVVPIVVDTRCQLTREKGILRKVFKDFGPLDTSYDIRCSCGPVIPHGKSKVMQEAAFDWMASRLEEWNMPVER